ncbi:HlyD family efflux transporter periplasmic adaptor subunit [Pseudoalteromonas xiamenensis]|uniref:HlyD family secretion protein n=1 Tax=Pseudoalteromonas xiamenensis TaxID=882626 RepID=UPI0027E59262|nr:HlyD family efflux transporter periplasmic adaptor subunit [Pseudoalteromonas xiamenensis]WMN58594.1 HlyD family efflux transporter periplasmic adaptor subunit [Pseudoalteromonas xiamenensis]
MDNLFRREVFEYKVHRLEGTVSLIQPPVFYRLAALIVLIVIISLLFLAWGNYTRKERVSGFIEPNTGVLKLFAPQVGVISEVLVKEGDTVEQGQPILRIESARHSVEGLELNQGLLNQYRFQKQLLEAQLAQLQQQHDLDMAQLRAEKQSQVSRLDELRKQAHTFQTRLALNKGIVEQISTLKGSGYVSELELTRQQDTLLALEQQSSSIHNESLSIENSISQLESRLATLPLEHERQVASLNSQIADVDIQLSSTQQLRLAEIRAPKSGTVTGLLAKPGKQVGLNQNLLSILPTHSEMQAVIYIPTEAYGFIKEGQSTRLRYHAFPYEKFGIYEGQIVEVSASVILPEEAALPGIISTPAYRVVVKLAEQNVTAYGKATPLRAGMTLDADVVIEERSLLRWLFDPVFSIKGQL